MKQTPPADVVGGNKEIGEWVDINGYEGLYQVSDLGLVRRLYKTKPPKILKQFFRDRYLSVGLSKSNEVKNYDVHVLVATYFIPNPENKPTVNHIKGNRLLNGKADLEWATRSEQILHAIKTGLFNPTPPTKKGDKLSAETKAKMSTARTKWHKNKGNVRNI